MIRTLCFGLLALCASASMSSVAGPSMTTKSTSSMKPVDIQLIDTYTGKSSLKLRIPAAYVDAEIRDGQGRLGRVWLVFWLPDYRPESHIAELRGAAPAERQEYIRVHRRNRVRISLSGEKREPGQLGSLIRTLREANERVLPDKFGLEHYRNRSCERLYELKRDGRDLSTRKCTGRYSAEYYFGHSEWSQQDFNISCLTRSSLCSIKSRFRGHFGQVFFAKEALPEWKEYDGHAHTFINKYVVRADVTGK